jgi:hypothetical protein
MNFWDRHNVGRGGDSGQLPIEPISSTENIGLNELTGSEPRLRNVNSNPAQTASVSISSLGSNSIPVTPSQTEDAKLLEEASNLSSENE